MPSSPGPLRSPAQVIVAAFAGVILVGTAALMLPVSHTGEGGPSLITALFTATSAVCVTGLAVVDTGAYWSAFGEAVILVLVQLGGLGIMSAASLLGLLVSRRMGLRTRITTAAESNQVGIGDVRQVLVGVAKVSLLFEAVVMVLLFLRFWLGYDASPLEAAHQGLFHSVMAFNQAGFALWSDSLGGFVTDPWVCLPILVSVVAGSLGFPVLFELRHELPRPGAWSLHTKMTVVATVALLVLGMLLVTLVEWNNPATLGALDPGGKLLAGAFQSAMPRSAGLSTLDYGQMHESTQLGTVGLMYIGGGPAGTAGGIKVTTFLLLLFVILAEVRGDREVTIFRRQIDHRALRQALSIALLSLLLLAASTFAFSLLTDLPTNDALFEVTSAFTTTGLSTGVTAELPGAAQLLLVGLMFIGRLGPITLVSALALREKPHLYSYPKGRPIIG